CFPSTSHVRELAMLDAFEEGVNAVLELRLRVVARILQVRLDQQSGPALLTSEVLAHVALAGREEAAALDRVDDDPVRAPFFDVAADLLVALQEVAVAHVLLEHVLGDALQRVSGVMLEAKFPQATDRRIGGGHRHGAPAREQLAEVAQVGPRWRAFDDVADLL